MNESNFPLVKKLRVPEFSISVLNLNMDKIDLTEKEKYIYNKIEFQTNDYYTCKICCTLVKEPKSCAECDDLFCAKCINNWLSRNNFCPHCKSAPFKERNISKLTRSVLNNI